jgi:hypothetical protein
MSYVYIFSFLYETDHIFSLIIIQYTDIHLCQIHAIITDILYVH